MTRIYTHTHSGVNALCAGALDFISSPPYAGAVSRDLSRKITMLRRSRGQTQGDFARLFGVQQATVSRWEKGAMPDYQHLLKLAEIGGTSVEELLGGGAEPAMRLPGTPVTVIGSVAAGVWKEAWEWPEEDRFTFHGGLHVDVQGERRFGLKVEGDSMDLVYPHGTLLDCVSIFSVGEVKPGQRVIVLRFRHDREVEATVKEYARSQDGVEWLLPRSTKPEFQSPIPVSDPGPDVAEITIVGIVVGSYRPE